MVTTMHVPRLLIVDDDAFFIHLIRKSIHQYYDYSAFVCTNITDAKTVLEKQNIDLVITDIFMPNGLGTELIRYIKDNHISTKVIAVSGGKNFHGTSESDWTSDEILVLAKDLGADCIITKPVDLIKLVSAIDRLIG
jgi:CheY-like chemotaxis protein